MQCRLGNFHLHHGNLQRARRHFLRAVEDDYPSFQAHLQLGRIYLRQDRVTRAVEELHRAREIDPHQFAREGFPGDPLLWIAERLPKDRVRQNLTVQRSRPLNSAAAEAADGLILGDSAEALPFGDFVDRAEAERFAALPPIALEDLAGVDWDELSRSLGEDG